jgi:hypothetical protein
MSPPAWAGWDCCWPSFSCCADAPSIAIAIGLSIFIAGPLLIATLALLSVHSAARDAAIGRADAMLVMNVMGTVSIALLILLAFLLRRRRDIHGAMLLGTALSFMGTAVFFTLLNVVPAYRIEGPETFHRFAEAGQASGLALAVVALLFFVRGPRTGWPWLLAGALFLTNGVLQGILAANQSTLALTRASPRSTPPSPSSAACSDSQPCCGWRGSGRSACARRWPWSAVRNR